MTLCNPYPCLEKKSFTTSDNVKIVYYTAGRGYKTILLIHGFASNAHLNWVFTGWVDFFIKHHYRVIVFDNRGHGQSQKLYDASLYHPVRMAQDAIELLQHLEISQTDVLGYSMGARITAFIAIHYPHYVDRIIFGGLAYNMIKGLPHTQDIYDVLMENDETKLSHYPSSILGYRLFAQKHESDLKALANSLLGSRTELSSHDIASIQNPVLVVVGSEDSVAGDVKNFCALMFHAYHVILNKRDHMKAITDKMFYQEVIQFLNKENSRKNDLF